MKYYSLAELDAYMQKGNKYDYSEVIEGCLIDTVIIYHNEHNIEVWKETYVNPWCSKYTRHFYHNGLPQMYIDALEEQYAMWDAE